MLDPILESFRFNLARVERLLALYDTLHGKGRGRRGVGATDLLRACTVFLHATLEDFLRSVARWRLPLAPPEVLDEVPVVGTTGRATAFKLGTLARFRGRTIDEFVAECVSSYLDRSNYNNTNEISGFLNSIGVPPAAVNKRFSDLDALMQRRHLIVHQADRTSDVGRGRYRTREITVHQVRTWITAAREFVAAAETELRKLPTQ